MAGFLSSAATQRPTLRHAWLCYWTFSDDGVALIKAQRPQARILVSLEEKQKRAKGDRAPRRSRNGSTGVLEGFRLRFAGDVIFASTFPNETATPRLDVRGDSLFGARLLPCSSFDSPGLMKGKHHENLHDHPCASALCRRFRRLRDTVCPATGLQRVAVLEPT
jgi:hypothetical protein